MKEADLRRENMIDEYGTTTIIEDAGFLFPDGTLISMVDEPQSGWTRCHALLALECYDALLEEHDELHCLKNDDEKWDRIEEIENKALENFLEEGNIRLVPDSPGFAISSTHKITKDQKMFLYDYVDYVKNEASQWSEQFYIDIHKPDGTIDYLAYDIDKLSVQRIMRDIENKANNKDIEK